MKRTLLPALCAALLAALAGCAASGDADRENRSIKIAIMDAEDVFEDDYYINGVEMAIEDLNALYGDQGYTISCQFYQDNSVFQQGMEAVNEIVADPDITAVVGTSSLNILDVSADVLDAAGKLLITYYSSSDDLFENGYTHVFRNCFGESDLGGAIARYAVRRPDIKRVAIYHSDTPYERRLVRFFLREAAGKGLEVVDVATTTPLQAELDVILERWRELDVDTVFVSQYQSEDAFDILRRVRHMDPDMNILGDFSFDYADFLEADGDVSDGICIATPVPLDMGPEVEAFYRKYREKYGAEPSQWTIQLYDSVRMVADTAVRIGSTDPTDIARALREPAGYTGVGGTLTFDPEGRLKDRQPGIMISRSGMFYLLEE